MEIPCHGFSLVWSNFSFAAAIWWDGVSPMRGEQTKPEHSRQRWLSFMSMWHSHTHSQPIFMHNCSETFLPLSLVFIFSLHCHISIRFWRLIGRWEKKATSPQSNLNARFFPVEIRFFPATFFSFFVFHTQSLLMLVLFSICECQSKSNGERETEKKERRQSVLLSTHCDMKSSTTKKTALCNKNQN